MTIDQLKTHIMAEITVFPRSYWELKRKFAPLVPIFILSTALKQMIMDGQIIRYKRIHYDSVRIAPYDYDWQQSDYCYLIRPELPLEQ